MTTAIGGYARKGILSTQSGVRVNDLYGPFVHRKIRRERHAPDQQHRKSRRITSTYVVFDGTIARSIPSPLKWEKRHHCLSDG